jgi:putative membrane protein
MKTTTFALSYISILLMSFCCVLAIAEDQLTAEVFVDQASAKGIAEIEAGHLAQREASHPDVKRFARMMVGEHGSINRELIRVARQKDIPVADEAELINTAKLNMLKVRDGESFDIAYARNQITTHEEAIALFQKAVFLDDRELSRFAEKNLPVLQEHLALAEQLLATVTPADMELPPRRTFESPADKPVETERPALQPAPREINPGVHNPSEQPAETVQ